MFHKQDLKAELQEKAKKNRISKTEANRQYIRQMNGRVEHVYRGELPFPEMSNRVREEVLACNGQVMYLYTQQW